MNWHITMLSIVYIYLSGCMLTPAPSDQRVINIFYQKEWVFKRLVEMDASDKHPFVKIGVKEFPAGSGKLAWVEKDHLSAARKTEYAKLLSMIRLKDFQGGDNGSVYRVEFPLFHEKGLAASRIKGLAYLRNAPRADLQFKSLNNESKLRAARLSSSLDLAEFGNIYRHIEGPWYVYYNRLESPP